ncbi:Hypothetical protein PHPALM_2059 [Phytophthora palmivora]|uniref:Uncharacterized protein n=1 Tax=Phytophthora palmivora TaxID=4796 RepID=A0A2P4YQY9_9STRA|nr:Hypothetical protein PHPALM_2059 [Phytophthora palmivora]
MFHVADLKIFGSFASRRARWTGGRSQQFSNTGTLLMTTLRESVWCRHSGVTEVWHPSGK